MFYVDNLPQIRNIFNYFTGSGMLLIKANWALDDAIMLERN